MHDAAVDVERARGPDPDAIDFEPGDFLARRGDALPGEGHDSRDHRVRSFLGPGRLGQESEVSVAIGPDTTGHDVGAP
jgi:hypothetical protein